MDSSFPRVYAFPRSVLAVLEAAILLFNLECASLTPTPSAPTQLTIRPHVSVTFGPNWQESGQNYARAYELVRVDPDESRRGGPRPPYPSHLARIVITTEPRRGHDDALQRLRDIARSHEGELFFYAIGGWPAVEVRFQERLPQPDIKDGAGPPSPSTVVPRAVVAVATPDLVVDFDIWLAPDSAPELLNEAVAIAKTATFAETENKDELARDIDALEQWSRSGRPVSATAQPSSSAAVGPDINVSPGPPTSVQSGIGELEIVSTPNANSIAIASNSGLRFSTNSGVTFSPGAPGAFGLSDPTLTRGASGNFYLGVMAFPTSVLGFTGCADAISTSIDNGATFSAVGFSAKCPTTGSICLPDQPHIAADSLNPSPQGTDQLYAVWRNFTPAPCLSCPPTCNSLASDPPPPVWQTSVIACSQDGGATWTTPTPLSGGGDHPRVAVGADGRVYAVLLDGNSVKLSRYSPCAAGLDLDSGFPVTVADDAGVSCPQAGLDRCQNALSSQMVAPDPNSASHIFVTYARHISDGDFEWIYSRESNEGGLTFSGEQIVSDLTHAHRFMPWSCSTLGTVFVGWYDRGAALGGGTNDLTNYMVGSPIFPAPVNLSVNPDPQCASGWTSFAPREEDDSEDCTLQPQLAGICDNASKTGSKKRCDYSNGGCPSGESCKTGGGRPKYGDYNGIACASNSAVGPWWVIAAWASATAPPGLPAPGGISIFSSVISVVPTTPGTWDQLRFEILTGQDGLRDSSEVTATVSSEATPICLKPSIKNSPDASCPNNGSGATDRTGRNSWENSDGVISQTFTVSTPQSLASGFGSLTIALTQGSCLGCTSDNWNIETIRVTAIDSTSTLSPTVLLNATLGAGFVDSTSCIARLREAPNAASVTFSLASPPTNTHTYNGGPSAGSTSMCYNNGG